MLLDWLLDYGQLAEGQTATPGICPRCGGGRSAERSFSVSRRDGSLLYVCFRASCNYKGKAGAKLGGRPLVIPKVHPAPQVVPLSEEAKAYLSTLYINNPPASWGELPDGAGRLVLPLVSLLGEARGWVLRAYRPGIKPKALTIKADNTASPLAWFRSSTTTDSVVIVEDVFSAYRASQYATSVALLGTHLGGDRLADIKAGTGLLKAKRVYLLLDADALGKSVATLAAHRSQLPMLEVRALKKDLKNMTPSELATFFEGLA